MTPVTIVTGASAGLGVDFAKALAARGERLVLVARRRDRLEALATEVGNARAVALDLSEPGAARALFDDLAAHGEVCSTLVNNAGFGLVGRFQSLDAARQRQMIDLNCGVLTELCALAVPAMVAAGRGRILNVASTAAFQPGPGMAVYFATKAYVLSFSEALHEEVRAKGVHVSALCPGPTATEFGQVSGFDRDPAFDRMAATSADVVRFGLAALDRNQAVAVHGGANRTSATLAQLLPRSAVRRATARILARARLREG